MDLSNYEPVKDRKVKFRTTFPDGRICIVPLRVDSDGAAVLAKVYKNVEEQEKDLPLGEGVSQEFKGQGSFANKEAWTENCEQSAIGRALDNAGFSAAKGPSREEMVKATPAPQAQTDQDKFNQATQAVEQVFGTSVGNGAPVDEYVVSFGKHKGKTLGQIGVDQVKGYSDWVNKQPKKSAAATEFLDQAFKFLNVAVEQDVPF